MAGSIAKAYVQIIPSADGIKGKLSGMLGKEAGAAGDSAGGSFASKLISKAGGIIAAAGLGKMLGDSLQAGGALQQSLGGVETLFKESADAVVKNAEKAYKTAGMSANQYMETVTGFSASLLQGLSGDTEKAAQVADMALTDMSDNANKMGSDMESIKTAYQGFAKQNYTMLDNLKLGYGGTKTEMERLLKDAQALSGVKYDIGNLSDVYSAIHVIQGELGITGTTAKEAAVTLAGSLASMKAAFSDVLANLSTGREIGPSLTALGETVYTFLVGNLLPMVGNALSALPEVLSSAFSMAIQGLNMAANNAESILQTGVQLVTDIGTAIVTAAPYLLEAAVNLVSAFGSAILSTDWGQVAADTITALRGSLDVAAAEILGTDGDIVGSMLDAIGNGLPDVLATGGKMLNSLVSGIAEALPGLTQMALDLLAAFAKQLISGLPQVLSTGKDILLNVVKGIETALPGMLASAGKAIGQLLTGIVQNLPSIIKAGFDLAISLISGIGKAAPKLLSGAGQLLKNILSAAKSINWGQVGRDIVNGLINGIGAMAGALWNAAKSIARSALNAIKSALGIASPSKVMRDEVGKWIPSGVAVGIEANTKPLTDAMHSLSGITTDTMQADLQMNRTVLRMPTVSVAGTAAGVAGSELQNQQVVELLGDLIESNTARQDAGILLLREMLGALLSINIGDDVIGNAVGRYQRKMAVMRGG